MSSDLGLSWSIDELAALARVPTRTVREYRTLGLIEPPRKAGRVGCYDHSHLRRLELIARLQSRGYSLAAIRDLCAASESGRSLEDVLGSGAIDQGAQAFTTEALVAEVPALADDDARSLAIEVGLIHAHRGTWHVRAPGALALVAAAIAAGASPASALRMSAGLADGARVQAAAFADLVVDELWDESDPKVADLVTAGRRARLHLAHAVASLVAHEVGVALRERAAGPGGRGLGALVDALQVGVVRVEGMD